MICKLKHVGTASNVNEVCPWILMRECLLVMLILILVILMLFNLNTGYSDTDADLYIKVTSLCCILPFIMASLSQYTILYTTQWAKATCGKRKSKIYNKLYILHLAGLPNGFLDENGSVMYFIWSGQKIVVIVVHVQQPSYVLTWSVSPSNIGGWL